MSGKEFARFAGDLTRAALGLEGAGERIVREVGQNALVSAKRVVPVDSGTLRGDLRLVVKGERAVVSTSTFYAAFQEFGTSQMAPNPFIGPAAQEWGPQLVLEVERLRDRTVSKL